MRTVRILYVEDNDDLRDAIGALVACDGREIVTFANAEDALLVMAQEAFDVLLTDVTLPGMSGIELARHWLAPNPARWVVLCSGFEFNHGLQVLGPNVRSLSKGFQIESLEELLAEIDAAVRAGDPLPACVPQRPAAPPPAPA